MMVIGKVAIHAAARHESRDAMYQAFPVGEGVTASPRADCRTLEGDRSFRVVVELW